MIPYIEPLIPADIDRSVLIPREHVMPNGGIVYCFPDSTTDLVKIDLIFEAGTALQEKYMQSAAAIQLITEGTSRRTAREIAEFMDFRGIVAEKSNDAVSATLTVYTLACYMEELVPLLYEMTTDAAYPQAEFDVYISKRRQQLLTNRKKTSYRARVQYYTSLYGAEHPLGRFASADDLGGLSVEEVRSFHDRYLTPSRLSIVVGGKVGEGELKLLDDTFGSHETSPYSRVVLPPPQAEGLGEKRVEVAEAVQNTLRVGRLLPFGWESPDNTRFMVLSTVLGGYFGSRLMSNIRDEKGYTYGINAFTQIQRGSILFVIATDVACGNADAAMEEIRREMQRLCEEPVPEEEIQLVRNFMVGDFMRGIDGVFERSERFCQMLASGVRETLTDNLMSTLEPGAVTSDTLQRLAQRLFEPSEMVFISAGRTSR